jgi:hypothetical protein
MKNIWRRTFFERLCGLLAGQNSLISELCSGTGTAFKEEGQGTSQEAIHQDDEQEYRD